MFLTRSAGLLDPIDLVRNLTGIIQAACGLCTAQQIDHVGVSKPLRHPHGPIWCPYVLLTEAVGYTYEFGERGGSVVECRTPEREVGGSKPTAAVLCPWARHFTPRKYWLITQEAVTPSRHDWKIVDWDVKPEHKQKLMSSCIHVAKRHQDTQRPVGYTCELLCPCGQKTPGRPKTAHIHLIARGWFCMDFPRATGPYGYPSLTKKQKVWGI